MDNYLTAEQIATPVANQCRSAVLFEADSVTWSSSKGVVTCFYTDGHVCVEFNKTDLWKYGISKRAAEDRVINSLRMMDDVKVGSVKYSEEHVVIEVQKRQK